MATIEEEPNFALNISLDKTWDDPLGLLDEEGYKTDRSDATTISFHDACDVMPTFDENSSAQGGGDVVASFPDIEPTKKRFFEVSDEQLNYIAGQTLAVSTKAQTRWGVGIFKGKYCPLHYETCLFADDKTVVRNLGLRSTQSPSFFSLANVDLFDIIA